MNNKFSFCCLLTLAVFVADTEAKSCDPQRPLPEKVNALVKPIFTHAIERDKRARANLPESEPYIETKLEGVFADRTPAGDAAVAYLLHFYLGEGPGEMLIINALDRGEVMRMPLEAFEKCLPNTGLEPLPKGLKGSGFLTDHVYRGFGPRKGIGRSK